MNDELKPSEHIETRVPGLDRILKGGLLKGSVYLVMGVPGAGKTIFANQVCFNHASVGGRALYVTLLAESHARMLTSLSGMAFFDEKRLAKEVTYLSGYQALEAGRLEGLTKFLRKAVRDHQATLLVIDGLITASAMADSEIALKKFVHELQAFAEMVGCTSLLLTGAKNEEASYPERTMVDGLFQLTRRRFGMRTEREFEVLKFRGSDNVAGSHFFDISEAGVRIHARCESVYGKRKADAGPTGPMLFGVEAMDAMFAGGVLAGSSTMVVGAPGSGKTILGLQFLAAAAAKGEPSLYFGFFEPPERLRKKGKNVSIDMTTLERDGLMNVMWNPPLELLADSLAESLLEAVTRLKVKRLFIDGLGGFTSSLLYSERTASFVFALTNELRALGVTTFISDETPQVLGQELRLPKQGVSEIVENLLVLRYVEANTQLRRVLSVIKMREGHCDSSLREFSISAAGFELGASFPSVGAVLAAPPARVSTKKRVAPRRKRSPKSR